MNRAILFRGFHECDNGNTVIVVEGKERMGEWVYGYYQYTVAVNRMHREFHNIVDFNEEVHDGGFNCTIKRNNWLVVQGTVGQYTGLTDNNVTQIFQDDKCVYRMQNGHKTKGVVVFEDCAFWLYNSAVKILLKDAQDIRVCGTIYDEEYANA